MTDHQPQSPATDNRPSGSLQNAIRFFLIAVPVLAAIPTVIQLGLAFIHWQPVSEVQSSLERTKIHDRNFLDVPDFTDAIPVSNGTAVQLGAYRKTGDIFVNVVEPKTGQPLFVEWISNEKLNPDRKPHSIWDILFSVANADELKPQRVAQALNYKIKCAFKPVDGKVTRIVQVQGKCFKERYSPFDGKFDPREEVESCATACQSADVVYDKG